MVIPFHICTLHFSNPQKRHSLVFLRKGLSMIFMQFSFHFFKEHTLFSRFFRFILKLRYLSWYRTAMQKIRRHESFTSSKQGNEHVFFCTAFLLVAYFSYSNFINNILYRFIWQCISYNRYSVCFHVPEEKCVCLSIN